MNAKNYSLAYVNDGLLFIVCLLPSILITFFIQIMTSPHARRPAPFLAVRCSQTEAQSAFLNFKGQPALLVIVGLAAALRVLCRKCRQPFFEIGVVGLHLNDAAILVIIDSGCLLLLGKPCSHKTSCIKKAATTISEVVTASATRCRTPAHPQALPPRRSEGIRV